MRRLPWMIRRRLDDQSGQTFILVMTVTALATVLGIMAMSGALMSIRLYGTKRLSDKNFYKLEMVGEEIRAGLSRDVAIAYFTTSGLTDLSSGTEEYDEEEADKDVETVDAEDSDAEDTDEEDTEDADIEADEEGESDKDKDDEGTDDEDLEEEDETVSLDPVVVLIPLLSVIAFLILFAVIGKLISRIRFSSLDKPEKIRRLSKDILSCLSLVGYKKESGETLSEFAERISPDMGEKAHKFADIYERLLYSEYVLKSSDLQDAFTCHDEAMKLLKKKSPVRYFFKNLISGA